LALDVSDDDHLQLFFNITMLDLKCDWAVIDVVSALGTDQNVSARVSKWQLDANGVRRNYRGRNRDQKDIELFDESVTATLEEMHENGEDAIHLDDQTFQFAKNENDYLFVDFYASWCNHCRDLAPTWEALAELMVDAGERLDNLHPEDYTDEDYEEAKKVKLPVMIAKIDCVIHTKVCNQDENIRAYPTLRLFVDGKPWKGGDYQGHRNILEMVQWLFFVEEELGVDESERQLHMAHQGKFYCVLQSKRMNRIVLFSSHSDKEIISTSSRS
jgi:thiol-disulfide isomerase/thioredoxin